MSGRRADRQRGQQDKLAAAHALLAEQVDALHTSADWQAALATAARFYRYSFGNTLLIVTQHARAHAEGRVPTPSPSYVAGFGTWQALGRGVIKGQHGYTILAPIRRTARQAVATDGTRRRLGSEESPGAGEHVETGRVTAGFTTAYVFDYSQTSGVDLPQRPRPVLLRGQAPPGLWDGLAAQVTAAGFTLATAASAAELRGANGTTDFGARTVTVRGDMDPAARVKTLAHELGHALLDGDLAGLGTHRGAAEVRAESFAYVIATAHGMDTADYSLPYVATWAGGDDPAAVVRATGEKVLAAARTVLTRLDSTRGGDGLPPGAERAVDAAHQHTQQRSAATRRLTRQRSR